MKTLNPGRNIKPFVTTRCWDIPAFSEEKIKPETVGNSGSTLSMYLLDHRTALKVDV